MKLRSQGQIQHLYHSRESLLEVGYWGNTTVGNTANIYTLTPIGRQNRTRNKVLHKHLVISQINSTHPLCLN